MSFTLFNKVIHKLDRFNTYANKEIFFGMFQSGKADELYIRFHNKYNRNVIDFYGSLNCDQRILFTDYMKKF